ncbi:MAG: hypothetical protein BWK76_11895 [Desulfobulbaceae bacterium A2]|nr:MAG: hypothetical protein BWK76_11895 [Desulfobulbaceae bacterium A2]
MSERDDWELDDMAREAHGQHAKGDELTHEIRRHQENVAILEEVMGELHGQRQRLESQQLNAALETVSDSLSQTRKRMQETLAERDELLRNNRMMASQLRLAMDERKRTLDKVTTLQFGAVGTVGDSIQKTIAAMHDDINSMGIVLRELQDAAERLSRISD